MAHSRGVPRERAVIFSSDVSARGLDYPDVTAVIQARAEARVESVAAERAGQTKMRQGPVQQHSRMSTGHLGEPAGTGQPRALPYQRSRQSTARTSTQPFVPPALPLCGPLRGICAD